MRRDDFEIEGALREALRAAVRGSGGPVESLAEAALADGSGLGRTGETLAGVFSGIMSQLENLARPAAAPSATWASAAAGVNPLLGGLLRLFGGSGQESTPQLPLAPKPETLRYEAAYERDQAGIFLVDRDESGMIRRADPPRAPAVIVHVEAMDSRSFVERAPEIAEVLRKVLLESDGLRTVLDG